MTKREALNGKPYAGNPHVRFDEGEAASTATSRRGSLLYNRKKDFIWAYMLKIGTNMWCDTMPKKWMRYKPEHVHYKKAADHIRCDDA